MATPPFDLDITDPTDTAIGDAFPANERTFRDNVNSYLNTEHDINTGFHAFQEGSTAVKAGLGSPPTGMLFYDNTLGQLQINTGTPSVPVWTSVSGPDNIFYANLDLSTNYSMVAADASKLVFNTASSGTISVQLPNTSTLPVGWNAGFYTGIGYTMEVSVQGSNSEKILAPLGQTLASFSMPTSIHEFMWLSFDGANFEIISASPNVWNAIGVTTLPGSLLYGSGNTFAGATIGTGLSFSGGTLAVTAGAGGVWGSSAYTGNTTFTIPTGVTSMKVSMVGGGGQGNDGGGGSGAFGVVYLTGLTPGQTITVVVGAGGTGGNGGNTSISSGTATIATATAGGGSAGQSAASGFSAAGGAGGSTSGTFSWGGGGQAGSAGIGASISGAGGSAGLLGVFGCGGSNRVGGENGIVLFEWVS